jgi:hypothetical protein
MKHLFVTIALTSSLFSFSQVNILDKSTKPKIKVIPYDGSFMNYSDLMLTNEKKAGIVGHKITLFKVWNIKKANGESIGISDNKRFENKSFEVIQYLYDYKDILRIKDEKDEYIFEPSVIDEFVINSYIDSLRLKLENQIFIPLRLKSELTSVSGSKISFDGQKEYKFSKIEFAKLDIGLGVIVVVNNEFELFYPSDSFSQPDYKGWINLSGSDILEGKVTFLNKDAFRSLSTNNKVFLNDIRSGLVKIGMTEKQCIMSWGFPNSSLNKIAGYDKMLRYGEIGQSDNLYFKGGILKLIK